MLAGREKDSHAARVAVRAGLARLPELLERIPSTTIEPAVREPRDAGLERWGRSVTPSSRRYAERTGAARGR